MNILKFIQRSSFGLWVFPVRWDILEIIYSMGTSAGSREPWLAGLVNVLAAIVIMYFFSFFSLFFFFSFLHGGETYSFSLLSS